MGTSARRLKDPVAGYHGDQMERRSRDIRVRSVKHDFKIQGYSGLYNEW